MVARNSASVPQTKENLLKKLNQTFSTTSKRKIWHFSVISRTMGARNVLLCMRELMELKLEVLRAVFPFRRPRPPRVDDTTVISSKDFDMTPRRVAEILRKKKNITVELTDKVSTSSSSSRTLADLNVLDAVKAFKSVTRKQGHDRMNRNLFVEFLEHIRVDADKPIVENVFKLMDRNGDGVIDGKELISGLTVLCGGY